MEAIVEFVNLLTNPDWIMRHGGLYLVLFIIFAETGLLIGFFLPGDPLLFITGMMIAGTQNHPYPFESQPMNLAFWMVLIITAAVIGNFCGYWFGRKSGNYLLERKDTWLFKKKHIESAQEFYEKKGGFAIILARFLPVVRTFAPIIGGVVKMDFKKFSLYNIAGAIVWVGSIVSLGYILGDNAWVKESLEYVILGLVLLSTAPVLLKMFFGKKTATQKVPVKELDEIQD